MMELPEEKDGTQRFSMECAQTTRNMRYQRNANEVEGAIAPNGKPFVECEYWAKKAIISTEAQKMSNACGYVDE